MDTVIDACRELDLRRRELGIPYSALSERSGVSQTVVQRLLTGKLNSPRFESVIAVARALGLSDLRILDGGSVEFDHALSAQTLRELQARAKARKLAGMVQGTSALEGQALDAATYEAMVERNYHLLLAGSNHRLWSEQVADWKELPGETPIDGSHLKVKGVSTHAQLNELEAVEIHPFYNGNGRWARMLTNIYLRARDSRETVWPEHLLGTESTIRNEYLVAIKAADQGDYAPLLTLHRTYAGAPAVFGGTKIVRRSGQKPGPGSASMSNPPPPGNPEEK